MTNLILASGSSIRTQLLKQACVPHQVIMPRIDEEMVKAALLDEGAPPRDVADALAELKARKISEKHPGPLVLGADQVLEAGGDLLSKPATREDAVAQLSQLQGKPHRLISAAVIVEDGQPIWRQLREVKLLMRPLSPAYIDAYVTRNWESIRHAVGCYKLEEEGVRLFSRVEGDYFTVLGLPLLDVLSYLSLRGDLET